MYYHYNIKTINSYTDIDVIFFKQHIKLSVLKIVYKKNGGTGME